MRTVRFRLLIAVTVASLAISATWLLATDKKSRDKNTRSAESQMDERQRALHALNRLTFGPRPGDVDRVTALGVDKWIEQQLDPRNIDDRPLESRLSGFRTLRMNSSELVQNFPPPQILKQIAAGKRGLPRDEDKRAIYEAGVERYRARQKRKQEIDVTDTQQGAVVSDDAAQEMTPEEKQERQQLRREARDRADELMSLDPDARMKAIIKMPADERQRIVRGLSQQEREQLIEGMSPEQKETLLAIANPTQVVVNELSQAKLLRAAYSERQLEEVMTDFWFNHFNVFINKGADRYLVTAYERDVIRPRALGKFSDLLLATAKSPAMMFYLDNWQSVGPNSQAAKFSRGEITAGEMMGRRGGYPRLGGYRPPLTGEQQQRINQAKQRLPKGLNENYAREVMELHTLGVNGGYSQRDVTELARVLSGWTIERPQQGGGFKFNERMHDPGEKHVLGKTFKEHGEKEGEQALLMLARHPSTARFVSRKLAMRFVSDDPAQALVDEMARTFAKTDGDIKEVLRTMFRSREFWASYRAKVKTPLEFVVSAVRATGTDVQNAQPLVRYLQQSGMQLYGAQPPTGYSMKSDAWVNSGALLSRLNFALGLGVGKLPGVMMNPLNVLGSRPREDSAGVQAAFEDVLLGGDVSRQTHDAILKQMTDPQLTGGSQKQVPPGVIAGLILGSPEFQRR